MPSAKATTLRPPVKGLVTGEELLRHPEWGSCELIDGEVVMLSPDGDIHGRVAGEIFYRIAAYVRRRKLGMVYAAESGFYLKRFPRDTVRAPDVMFVARERLPGPRHGYLEVAPDLAVEVVDPEDPALDAIEKAQSFVDAGVKLVWVVDGIARRALVYEHGKPPRLLSEKGMLEGGRVLPRFKLPLATIWRGANLGQAKRRSGRR